MEGEGVMMGKKIVLHCKGSRQGKSKLYISCS